MRRAILVLLVGVATLACYEQYVEEKGIEPPPIYRLNRITGELCVLQQSINKRGEFVVLTLACSGDHEVEK